MSIPLRADRVDVGQPRLYGHWRAERGWGIGRLSSTATIIAFLAMLAPLLAVSAAPVAVLPLTVAGGLVVAALAIRIGGRSAADVLGVPDDAPYRFGLAEAVSPLRMRGMVGMLSRIKRQVRLRTETPAAGAAGQEHG